MGPWHLDWYRARGLTQKVTKTATENTMFYAIGETYTTETITTQYSCGRLDVRGVPDEPYGLEISVPCMLSSDWQHFGNWLHDVQTASVWTLTDLVAAYEHQTGNKIIWDTYEPTN
jgi:hypothetical protein